MDWARIFGLGGGPSVDELTARAERDRLAHASAVADAATVVVAPLPQWRTSPSFDARPLTTVGPDRPVGAPSAIGGGVGGPELAMSFPWSAEPAPRAGRESAVAAAFPWGGAPASSPTGQQVAGEVVRGDVRPGTLDLLLQAVLGGVGTQRGTEDRRGVPIAPPAPPAPSWGVLAAGALLLVGLVLVAR